MTVTASSLVPLDDLLKDHVKWHSGYQIDRFIIGSELTAYGAYKQALRETHKRAGLLRQELLEYQRCKIDIMELEEQAKADRQSTDNAYAQLRRGLDLKQKRDELDAMKFMLTHRKREMARFWAHASVLKGVIGDLTEPRREILEKRLWMARLRFTALVDMLRDNAPSRTVIEMVVTMPPQERRNIIKFLSELRGNGEALATMMAEEQESYLSELPEGFEAMCRSAADSVDEEALLETVTACPLLSLETGTTP